MKYLDLMKDFGDRQVISVQNMKNRYGEVNRQQLSVWAKRGWLVRVKKGFYVLPGKDLDVHLLANRMNKSYISLEYALSFYQLIPEISRVVTSVSCERGEKFENQFGRFNYFKIKPDLFIGYVNRESKVKGVFFQIASLEKALFDLVYFRKDLKNKDDLLGLRLNPERDFDLKMIYRYIGFIRSRGLKKRLLKFFKNIDA